MRMLATSRLVALLVAAAVSRCGVADRREVYRGSNGEPLAAIVAAIDAAERSVLARSPALPRQAVLETLAAARRRGVLVEFVVCEQGELPAVGESTLGSDAVSIRFDRGHHPKSGAVLVIDSRTVVRTSYPWDSGNEAAMIFVIILSSGRKLLRNAGAVWLAQRRSRSTGVMSSGARPGKFKRKGRPAAAS